MADGSSYDAAGNLISEGGKIGAAAAGGFANPFTDISALLGGGELVGGLLGLNAAPAYKSPPIDPQIQAMVSRAQEMSKHGYDPEQITAFYNSQAEQNTARLRNATDRAGGSLAGAVNAGNNAFNTDSLNKFAAADAALKDKHQLYADSTLKYLQSLEDKGWTADNNHLTALNSAFGGAMKTGLSTLTGALGAGAAGFGKGTTTDPNNPNSTAYQTKATNDQNGVNHSVDYYANAFQTENDNAPFKDTYQYNFPQTDGQNAFQQAGTPTGLTGTY